MAKDDQSVDNPMRSQEQHGARQDEKTEKLRSSF